MRTAMLVLAAVLAGSANAMNVFEYKKAVEQNRASEVEILLVGMGRALVLSNAIMERDSGSALYCQPRDVALTARQYREILDDEIRKFPGVRPDIPLEFLLVGGLKRTFPCR